jgi:hypothetical protein
MEKHTIQGRPPLVMTSSAALVALLVSSFCGVGSYMAKPVFRALRSIRGLLTNYSDLARKYLVAVLGSLQVEPWRIPRGERRYALFVVRAFSTVVACPLSWSACILHSPRQNN